MGIQKKTKRLRFPGGKGATVYDIGEVFFENIRDLKMGERAAAISFNFLMAIPPTLIFLFSLVPFLPLDSVQDTILSSIQLLSPNERLFVAAQHLIIDFMQTKQRELLSFGFLTTIFVSSNGVMGLLRSFDRDSPAHVERTGLARRWKAIRITLILMVVILIAIALLIFQSNLLNYILPGIADHPWIVKGASWVSLVGIIYITICIIYKYGPSLNYKFGFFSPGAALATILFLAVSYGFFFVANHFLNYNKVYGSIGTLLMLMAWMFMTGLVMIVGFECNLALIMHRMKNTETSAGTDVSQKK